MEEIFKKNPYYIEDIQKQYLQDVDFSADNLCTSDKKPRLPLIFCEGWTELFYLEQVLDVRKCKCEKATAVQNDGKVVEISNVKKIFEEINKKMTENPMLQIYAVFDHDPISNALAQFEFTNKILAKFPKNVFRVFSKPSFEMVFLCAFLSQQAALTLESKEDLAEKYKPKEDYHSVSDKACLKQCAEKQKIASPVEQQLNRHMENKYSLTTSKDFCANWKPFNKCVKTMRGVRVGNSEKIDSYLEYYIKHYFAPLNFISICQNARKIYPESLISENMRECEWYSIEHDYTEIFHLECFAVTTLQ